MHPYRCKVTGASSTTPVGAPVAPEWCEEDQSSCVSGPKKFIIVNQQEANTVTVTGYQANGQEKSPGYNTKMGFNPGMRRACFVPFNADAVP